MNAPMKNTDADRAVSDRAYHNEGLAMADVDLRATALINEVTSYDTPSLQTYKSLDLAFQYFRKHLFQNRLPDVHLVIHRKRGARGYFWADQFRHRDTGEIIDEIALNPESMDRNIPAILSTLVHEMVHLRQQHEGKPSKTGHNREWGKMMDEIGLTPTSTGVEGGKRTGRSVTHMIVDGGPFDKFCSQLVETGFALPWFTNPPLKKDKKTDTSKVKHTCPDCNVNAWGKLGIRLVCGDCEQQMFAADDSEVVARNKADVQRILGAGK